MEYLIKHSVLHCFDCCTPGVWRLIGLCAVTLTCQQSMLTCTCFGGIVHSTTHRHTYLTTHHARHVGPSTTSGATRAVGRTSKTNTKRRAVRYTNTINQSLLVCCSGQWDSGHAPFIKNQSGPEGTWIQSKDANGRFNAHLLFLSIWNVFFFNGQVSVRPGEFMSTAAFTSFRV